MASGPASEMWSNELVEALLKDPSLSQATKDICKKIKYKQNPWQLQLKKLWLALSYPAHDATSIVQLNCQWKKNVEAINAQRANQRQFYINQGDPGSAAQIPDIDDKSMSERASVIKSELKSSGWNPAISKFEILINPCKPDITKMSDSIDHCVHSGSINVPRTIMNLLDIGTERGFTEQHYSSLFLQFIKTYIPNAHQAALTYSRDTNELFNFLLSIVDTEQEVSKIRLAILKISRKPEDPISLPVLKMKSLMTSLFYMLDPECTINNVNSRAEKAAIDAMYCLISPECKTWVHSWKRRCTEMQKPVTLMEHLECVNKVELTPSCKITRELTVPGRLADSDVQVESFFSKYGMSRPSTTSSTGRQRSSSRPSPSRYPSSTRPSRSPSQQNRSSSSPSTSNKFGRNRAFSPGKPRPRSSSGERSWEGRRPYGGDDRRSRRDSGGRRGFETSREREMRKQDGSSNGGGHYSNSTGAENNTKRKYPSSSSSAVTSSVNKNKNANAKPPCKNCGSSQHNSYNCLRYPFWYSSYCQHCLSDGKKLYHPSDSCRFRASRYKTPPPPSSPKSYRSQSKENLTKIFSGQGN